MSVFLVSLFVLVKQKKERKKKIKSIHHLRRTVQLKYTLTFSDLKGPISVVDTGTWQVSSWDDQQVNIHVIHENSHLTTNFTDGTYLTSLATL